MWQFSEAHQDKQQTKETQVVIIDKHLGEFKTEKDQHGFGFRTEATSYITRSFFLQEN